MLEFLIGNDALSAILAFGIVLIPAVIIHELGHFLAARAVGITVLEFGIGFPPRIAKLFTWRETEFTLNLIPLGGFVRPLGEDMIRPVGEEATQRDREKVVQARTSRSQEAEAELSEREELAARGFENTKAVHEVKPWPRILFMASGPIANFILAFLMFVAIGLIGLPEQVGVRVGFAAVPAGSPLELAGLQPDDFIERVDGKYFTSAVEMANRLEASVGKAVTIQVRRTSADPDEIFMMALTPTDDLVAQLRNVQSVVLITQVTADSPGEAVGLVPGDVITAFNGDSLTSAAFPDDSLVEKTNAHAGEEVTLTILRDGETLDVQVTPRENPPPGDGRIGIGIAGRLMNPDGRFSYVESEQFTAVPQPLGESVAYGFERVGSIFRLIAEFPARLLGGTAEPEERRVVSVVGISQLGGAILQDSIEEEEATPFLEYIALISIALGFTNLLPIPALDGGRIMFVVLELIRGKPIPPEREGLVHLVGVIFILSIGVFFIINDLMNPLTDWIR